MSSHHNGNSGSPGTLFGLQCACQPLALYKNPSIAKGPTLKSFFFKSESRCRKGCSRDHKKLEPSTSSFTSSQRNPKASWGFPHPNPPPRLRPSLFCASTAAFASRSRWTTESWPLRAAKCSGVLPQEPRPEAKPQAEPNRTNWEKLWDNFGAPSQSFENWGHSIFFLDLS